MAAIETARELASERPVDQTRPYAGAIRQVLGEVPPEPYPSFSGLRRFGRLLRSKLAQVAARVGRVTEPSPAVQAVIVERSC